MRRLAPSVGALLVLTSLLVANPAGATFPGQNGRIAYELELPGRIAIYSSDASGVDQQAIIDLSDRDAIDPAWARGGIRIAYAAQTVPGGPFAIFIADADGSDTEQVTTPVANDRQPTWSPQGDQIAFTREGVDGSIAVHVVSLTDLTTQPLVARSPSFDPSWSPGGRRIAFASTALGNGEPCEIEAPGCAYSLWIHNLDDGQSHLLTFGARSPSWFPAGDRLAATEVFGPEPIFTAVFLHDATTGERLDQVGGRGVVSDPAPSPDGQWLAMRALNFDDQDNVIDPEISIVNLTTFELISISGPVSDPTWAVVPGTEGPIVPDGDVDPPSMTFETEEEPLNGWHEFRVTLLVSAEDAAGVDLLECMIDDQPPENPTYIVGPGFDLAVEFRVPGFSEPAGGIYEVECTATDGLGNEGSSSTAIRIDRNPPSVSDITFTPSAVPGGSSFEVSACIEDVEVGLGSASAITSTGSVELSPIGGCHFAGELVATTFPGPQPVTVIANDLFGNERLAFSEVVIFDPAASAFGNGRLTPGGPTSLPGDTWPHPLDGRRKASFSVDVRYRKGALVPSGSFLFTYATSRFESKSFDWLTADTLRGTGSFRGDPGRYPFELELSDGGPSSADYFVLRVFDPIDPVVLYRVSGDVTGQVTLA